MNCGFSQTGLDALQSLNALAFEITFACAREHGFGGKTVLNTERIFHDPFQSFLRVSHVSNLIKPQHNRKSKNPARLNLSIALTRFRE
jgi:hypothetical protein